MPSGKRIRTRTKEDAQTRRGAKLMHQYARARILLPQALEAPPGFLIG